MADTYGVMAADIAAELPGLYPGGFDASTKPTLAQVTAFIAVEDLQVTVAVQNASGATPAGSDRMAPVAKQTVIYRVVARVLRLVYAGNAPQDVNAAAGPYDVLARDALASITALDAQSAGAGEPVNRIMVGNTVPTRDLIVQDEDLNPGPSGPGAGRFGGRRQGQF